MSIQEIIINQINYVQSHMPHMDLNILFLLGLALFGGTIGGRFFKQLKIPQVVGYIIIGLLVGDMGLHIISADVLTLLSPINYFALGLIGFMIGGELRGEVFKKYGKQFILMVFTEGIGAFLLVAPLVALAVWFLTHDLNLACILGLVIGAISSATDPASTMQVFWEYKTRGVLTTAVTAIVALDDALALTLYAIATSIASFISRGAGTDVLAALFHLSYEICGAILVGLMCGLILKVTYNYLKDSECRLPFSIGLILLAIGIAQIFHLDIILAALAFGCATANMLDKQSDETFALVKSFSMPIYVLFFVFVGAQLNVKHMSVLIGLLIAIYVIARSIGKVMGVYIGARFSGAPQKVQKYAGLCLFSQAGVAVGLSIVSGQRFPQEISEIIITVIAATTFIVQLIGPACVKIAVKKGGEIGLNITEDDLIASSTVRDFMDPKPPVIFENMKMNEILVLFKNTPNLYYPVVSATRRILGLITVAHIKETFLESDLDTILLAYDIMEPVRTTVRPTTSIREVKQILQSNFVESLPVVDENEILVGFIESNLIDKIISTKMIELRKKAIAE
jgi:Kef-type K+ transport system membrane component KefB/predicted transcriptional regulator